MEDVGIFMAIWSILRSFGIVCGHFVQFMVIWYIFSCFGMLCQEKSGNPRENRFGKKECCPS
jgi:hypothetical protein